MYALPMETNSIEASVRLKESYSRRFTDTTSGSLIVEAQRLRSVHPRTEVVKSERTTRQGCIRLKMISKTTTSVLATPGDLKMHVVHVLNIGVI